MYLPVTLIAAADHSIRCLKRILFGGIVTVVLSSVASCLTIAASGSSDEKSGVSTLQSVPGSGSVPLVKYALSALAVQSEPWATLACYEKSARIFVMGQIVEIRSP